MAKFRVELIQNYIDKYSYSHYLEIGTFEGESFFPLVCRKKIAVDPKFQFTNKKKIYWLAKNSSNLRNSYYQMESNSFFSTARKKKLKGKIDIAFIDGLHTFKASLEDTLNALSILQDEGRIILHDCLPPHEAAAVPANSYSEAYNNRNDKWTGEWCGDVWKTVLYLKKKYPESLEIFTIDRDYGLGVVRPLTLDLDLVLDIELFDEINNLDYNYFRKDCKNLLNLIPQNIF